ncbi:MAG: ATP-binding protein [Dissulfurispiraceae bacterium]
MNIATRLKINILLFAGMVFTISLFFVMALRMQQGAFERSEATDELARGSYLLSSLSDRYLRYPEKRPKEQWKIAYNALVKNLYSIELKRSRWHYITGRMGQNLNNMRVLFDNLVATVDEKVPGPQALINNTALDRQRTQLADLIVKRSREVSLDAVRLTSLSNEEIADINRRIIIFIPIVIAVLSAITLLSAQRISRSIINPINKLRAGVEIIGSGNTDVHIGAVSNDEIGELSKAFDQMAEHLKATTVSRDELAKEVAERKLAQKEQAHLASFPELNPTPILEINHDGKIIYVNPTAMELFPDIAAAGLEHPFLAGLQPVISQFKKGLIRSFTREVEANRSFFHQTVHHVPEIDAVRVYSADITLLKRAEEEREMLLADVQRSNKELVDFAYVASHDLQEPLRTMSSFAELLANKYRGKLDEKADTFIGYIVDSAGRMKILINDILAYSRVTTMGKAFAETDCNAVFSRIIMNLQLIVKEAAAKITCDTLPTVMADSVQLGQLFQNLIGNAIKYHGEEPPKVHISARKQDAEWFFSVADNGIGIEQEYFERIFVIFQRLHGRANYPGTGIGLAVCKKIVERHGGRIWVESETGKGSTFYFTIPERGENKT